MILGEWREVYFCDLLQSPRFQQWGQLGDWTTHFLRCELGIKGISHSWDHKEDFHPQFQASWHREKLDQLPSWPLWSYEYLCRWSWFWVIQVWGDWGGVWAYLFWTLTQCTYRRENWGTPHRLWLRWGCRFWDTYVCAKWHFYSYRHIGSEWMPYARCHLLVEGEDWF